jgi:hypothetical protein
VIDLYTSLSRRTVKENWPLEPEAFAKLEFNEDGSSLACGIESSRIVEHVTQPNEYWIVEVVPDFGIWYDSEEWIAYQAVDGTWIVESD